MLKNKKKINFYLITLKNKNLEDIMTSPIGLMQKNFSNKVRNLFKMKAKMMKETQKSKKKKNKKYKTPMKN